MAYGIENPGHV